MKKALTGILFLFCVQVYAQKNRPLFTVSGSAGVSYEGYGLTLHPHAPYFYGPRRPWNQVRFNIAPQINIGKNFSLPLNFNFATRATNFAGPYAGIGSLGHQSFWQFIGNPLNSFSINPTYKSSKLLLGTQYLNYSELSTGDIGIFGAGFDLNPRGFIIKFFYGNSQQGINASTTPPVTGAYKQTNWMFQLGKEKKGQYKMAFTVVKGRDSYYSASPPPALVTPREGIVFSVINNAYFKKGYYAELEGAHSIYSNNFNAGPALPGISSFKPLITANASTVKDYAATVALGKKSANFDIGAKLKYLGAGFHAMGYPYQQPDKLDATLNTRFNAWKDKNNNFKMNVIASIGDRVNNISSAGTRNNQFLANINWFTQFSDHWSLNLGYNNFGFTANGSTLTGVPSVKNVSNDLSVNPTYTWSNSRMSHTLTLSYTYSKYKETSTVSGITTITNNNTHTALLNYVPVYFSKNISPDFSALYFLNEVPGYRMQLFTLSTGLGVSLAKSKLNLKGQLQYTLGKNAAFTHTNNLVAGCNLDYALTKKLKWNLFMSTNYFKYGNELGSLLIGANYLESNLHTGLTYTWK